MSRGIQKARTDSNHTQVVAALRAAGIATTSTATVGDGFPDLVCSFRTVTVLLEVKDGEKVPSARKLSAAEQKFHDGWPGNIAVVTSPEEAICAVIAEAKRLGQV